MAISYIIYLDTKDKRGKIYACSKCKTHFAYYHDIRSRDFRGHYGRAFLFDKVHNTNEKEAVERSMSTGRHVVRDITCSECSETVGWRYESAGRESEKYKEGKYILEAELLCLIHQQKAVW